MQKETFTLDVEGVGHFIILSRTMRIEMRIGAEYSRLTEGVPNPSHWLDRVSTMMAVLTVLTVESPDDWDIESMDPLDIGTYSDLAMVYNELRGQEARFRSSKGTDSKDSGQGDGGVGETVVSTNVQASA